MVFQFNSNFISHTSRLACDSSAPKTSTFNHLFSTVRSLRQVRSCVMYMTALATMASFLAFNCHGDTWESRSVSGGSALYNLSNSTFVASRFLHPTELWAVLWPVCTKYESRHFFRLLAGQAAAARSVLKYELAFKVFRRRRRGCFGLARVSICSRGESVKACMLKWIEQLGHGEENNRQERGRTGSETIVPSTNLRYLIFPVFQKTTSRRLMREVV